MVTCSACENWQLRDKANHVIPIAKHGFGSCAKGYPWTYYPPTHTCPKRSQAAPDVVEARAKWLLKKGS